MMSISSSKPRHDSGYMMAPSASAPARSSGTPSAEPQQRPVWGAGIYHSAKAKKVVNALPKLLAVPVEVGLMLTATALAATDMWLHPGMWISRG